MKQTFTFLRLRNLIILPLLLGFSISLSAQTVVWQEDFEGEWINDWHVDAGTWEVGTPSSGPEEAYSGNNCAATILAGNYSDNVASKLIRHTSFTVPDADENPRLRFWHWFSHAASDYGCVMIKTESQDWTRISREYRSTSSNYWTQAFIDLSEHVGSTVQIAFYFYSHNDYGSVDVSSGWYIDDIELETGPLPFNSPQGWENGFDHWYADYGTWQVGAPTSGPMSAFNGQNCAATILEGNYTDDKHSRLISPKFTVPDADENPRLRFWHWFSHAASDYGCVMIKTESQDWTRISREYRSTSSNYWTQAFIDLSEHVGSTVQIAFYFYSHNDYGSVDVSSGWYIDDIELETGPLPFNSPQGWENGFDHWYADYGTWQVGAPTSGPMSAFNGQNCAATILEGNYTDDKHSRLISPKFTVPDADENPRLRFWHWFSHAASDYGCVMIKTESQDWTRISREYRSTSSNYWTQAFIDLSEHVGSTVQIAFYFYSHNDYGSVDVSSGWYIDDIELETGPLSFNSPQGWENGFDHWYADYGTWQVGAPTSGPMSAYNGQNCAATILEGNYTDDKHSRLISPKFTVPDADENPRLRFWHWFSFSSSDYGIVQVKVTGTSEWINIPSAQYTGASGNIWSYTYFPLTDYAGSTIQIAFYFYSHNDYGSVDVSSGWYIDDVVVEPNVPTNIIVSETNNLGLLQNSPNPFAISTEIKYAVKKSGLVSLNIYNSSGVQVKSLVNAVQSIGDYKVTLNASELPSGIYFYSLQVDNKIIATRKMIAVR